ncbi:LacI family DNA-binding transcriptional regulator [Streptomyces sp. 7R007]
MKEVAEAAGVSRAAVSYAFAQSPKVSPAQREHILATAAHLGYMGPHIAGSSLRSGHVGAIGVMVMGSLAYALEDPSTTLLLQGIVEVGELSHTAMTLLPLSLDSQALTAGGIGHPALRGLVDGLLVHSLPDKHPLLEAVVSRGLPTVVVDAPVMEGVGLIGIEDRKAAEAQMSHLLEHGHRRIGVVADRLLPDGRKGRVSTRRLRACSERVVRERLRGYADACRKHGVPWNSVNVVEAGAFNRTSGLEAARLLLDLGPVTGIAATSDVMALAALDVLAERGLHCPADVSVIGFDDAPAASAAQLTTIRQPLLEKGRLAARLLFQQLAGGKPERVVLPTELVVRKTTGAGPDE